MVNWVATNLRTSGLVNIGIPQWNMGVVPLGYMRVVLNSFIWKTSSSPKKNFLSPNFRELHVFLSRYMLAKILKKNVDV